MHTVMAGALFKGCAFWRLQKSAREQRKRRACIGSSAWISYPGKQESWIFEAGLCVLGVRILWSSLPWFGSGGALSGIISQGEWLLLRWPNPRVCQYIVKVLVTTLWHPGPEAAPHSPSLCMLCVCGVWRVLGGQSVVLPHACWYCWW